jgi:hypothetical protein
MLRAGRVVALVMALVGAACASTPETPGTPPVTRRPEPQAPITIDVSRLFPVQNAVSVVDVRAVVGPLLSVIHVDTATLLGGSESGVEPWLGRALFAWLVDKGAEVRARPEGATSSLVGVRFLRVPEKPRVRIVRGDDGAFEVHYRNSAAEDSLCPADLTVPVDYVQFEGALLGPNSRVIATFAEAAAVVPATKRATIEAAVDVYVDPCVAVADLFAGDGAFAPTPRELDAAAGATLMSAFRALVGPVPTP